MISSVFHALTTVAAATDTVWVHEPPQGAFDRISSVAGGVLTIIALLAVLALAPMVWGLRRRIKSAEARFAKLNVDLRPLLTHASAIADNVDYISTAVREDVGAISETLRSANDRLQEAIASTERQLRDFNALLTVVQQEAEGVFVATAATVRGVRTGASHLASDSGTELASVEADDDLEVVEDDEDTIYGNDGFTDDEPDATRGPRVIRRRPAR